MFGRLIAEIHFSPQSNRASALPHTRSLLFLSAPEEQGGQVFAASFIIPWLGAGVITVNSVVLGGKMFVHPPAIVFAADCL
jgi:hypothetical protein